MSDQDPRSLLVVFTSPSSGVTDDEFNDWYDGTHVPELLQVAPGIVSIRRFQLDDAEEATPQDAHRFLAIYELAQPPAEVLADIRRRPTTLSPVLDTVGNPPRLIGYRQISTAIR